MEHDELMITPDELAARLDEDDVRVVDVRWSSDDPEGGRRAHREAHVPGAVYLHWHDDLSDPDDPVEGQLAGPERFADTMSRAGIGNDTLVVAYDDNSLFMAPRLLWALHHYGHDRVRVLDGGFPGWHAAGHELEGGPVTVEPRDFTVTEVRDLRLTKDDMLAQVQGSGPDAVVLDCRMDRSWTEAGAHIPGARRLPSPTLVRSGDGRVIPAGDVAARARELGAEPDEPVMLYCGGGVSASAGYLALRRAGYENVRVYDGSWSEWSADPEVPVEQH